MADVVMEYQDLLMQQKVDETHVNVLFPVTRYEAVIGSPKVLNDMTNANNVPFVLLVPSFNSNGY